MLAQAHFSAKALHGLSRKQQKEKLLNEKQIDWEKEPNWFKHGAIIKKEVYEKQCVNVKTGEETIATRTRLVCKAFRLQSFSEAFVNMLVSKYWDSSFDEYVKENNISVEVEDLDVE